MTESKGVKRLSYPYIVWMAIFVVAPLILVVVFYLGGEISDGLLKSDNVSQMTHIVGGVCGIVFGFTLPNYRRR